ncbi:hypothetical protein QT971_18645 [Microcoleus sp. herbarium19]
MQCVLLSTVFAFALAFPQKPENSSTAANQLATSQKLLSAKDSGSKSDRCNSSPTPGCSRRNKARDT